MSNWNTMVQGIVAAAGGGRSGTGDLDAVRRAIVDAIAHEESQHYYFTAERFDFATVADQESYGTADGVPSGVVEVLGEYLFLDPLQDADNRRAIRRQTAQRIDELRAGVAYTSEPEVWGFFGGEIELYPTPDAVHDVRGRVSRSPGTPIYRIETTTWKFYKPGTTSFVAGNELTDAYPSSPDTNAWFTDTLAFRVIRSYAEYLLYAGVWHASKGQDMKALQRYTEFRAALEDRTSKLTRPARIEPFDLRGI